MSRPRKHHYCPEMYLKNFTDDKNFLQVYDKEKKKFRPSKPVNEACQKDFYWLDSEPGEDPLILEKELGKIESHTEKAISYIIKNLEIPDGEMFSYLMNFIGLLAERTPPRRNWVKKSIDKTLKTLAKHIVSTEMSYENYFNKMAKNETEAPVKVPYNDIKDFVLRGQYNINVSRNYLIKIMLGNAAVITDLLAQRNWIILVNESDSEFITGDHPVELRWSNASRQNYGNPPGYGLHGTEVFLPITKNIGLVGSFEDSEETISVKNVEVLANFNSWVVIKSERYIYSSSKKFYWLDHKSNLMTSDNL